MEWHTCKELRPWLVNYELWMMNGEWIVRSDCIVPENLPFLYQFLKACGAEVRVKNYWSAVFFRLNWLLVIGDNPRSDMNPWKIGKFLFVAFVHFLNLYSYVCCSVLIREKFDNLICFDIAFKCLEYYVARTVLLSNDFSLSLIKWLSISLTWEEETWNRWNVTKLFFFKFC